MSQATAEVLVAAGCLSIHSNNRLVGSAGLPIASQPLPGRPLVGCEAPERSNKADEQRTLCNNGPWQIASQHFIACHVDADDLRLELDSEAAAWGGSRELDRQADAVQLHSTPVPAACTACRKGCSAKRTSSHSIRLCLENPPHLPEHSCRDRQPPVQHFAARCRPVRAH